MMALVYVDALHGINYHRLIAPLRNISEDEVSFHWIQGLNELSEIDLNKVDFLIVSRKISVEDYPMFKRILKKYNVKLVLDNDDYWDLDKSNPAFELYQRFIKYDIINTIKIADIIWSPSYKLIKRMRRINRTASYYYVPNAIDPLDEQWIQRKTDTDEVRFGYLGASGHKKDIDLMGYTFENKILKCVDIDDYKEYIGATEALPVADSFSYGAYYELIDVSLSPLGGGTFNLCKSNLKVTEAGFTKTAIIASNVTPYKESIIHGKTGILCSNKYEWRHAIDNMTLETARELGENLYESVKDRYNIHTANSTRIDSLFQI
jgi:glycosyltransferase involved in cell wall biosynthesis